MNRISSKSPNLPFRAYVFVELTLGSKKGSLLKCSVKKNVEYINTNFAFIRGPVFPVIPKHVQNICSLRDRFQKFGQMSTDITGVYELVKNAVSRYFLHVSVPNYLEKPAQLFSCYF